LVNNVWPSVYNCLIPPVDKNGQPHGWNIQAYNPSLNEELLEKYGIESDKCTLFSENFRPTFPQFIITSYLVGGILGTTAFNGIFYVIYRLEHPLIEQFKIEKDVPWPWKQNPNTPKGA